MPENQEIALPSPYETPAAATPSETIPLPSPYSNENQRRFGEARAAYSTMDEDVTHYLAQAAPFASTFANVALGISGQRARQRLEAGRPEPLDYRIAAMQDRRDELAANRSVGEDLGMAAARGAGMAGEALMGGALLRGGGLAISAATEASPWLARAAQFAANQAISTPFIPSLYAERAIHNNAAAHRDPADWRGLPNALGMAYAQNLILGSLGGPINRVAGQGIGGLLVREGIRVPVGIFEQAAADVTTSALGMDTGYGTIGQFARGEYGPAWRGLAMQAMQFTLFGLMHEIGDGRPTRQEQGEVPRGLPGPEPTPGLGGPGPERPRGGPEPPPGGGGRTNEPPPPPRGGRPRSVMESFRDGVNRMAEAGFDRQEAVGILQGIMHELQSMTAEQRAGGFDFGREFARRVNEVVRTRRPGQARQQPQPEQPRPAQGQTPPAAPGSPLTSAPSEPTAAQPVPPTPAAAPPAPAAPPQPAPAAQPSPRRPGSTLHDAELRQIGAQLGLTFPKKTKPSEMLDAITANGGEWFLRAAEQPAKPPEQPPAPPPAPEPEPAQPTPEGPQRPPGPLPGPAETRQPGFMRPRPDKDIQRQVINGLLDLGDNPTQGEISAVYRRAGYIDVDGFMVHPGIDANFVRGLKPETKQLLQDHGIVFFQPETEHGAAGSMQGAAGSVQVSGIGVNTEAMHRYSPDHTAIHELGHHIWESLTQQQRDAWNRKELTTDYARNVRDRKTGMDRPTSATAHEEEFAERLAFNHGDVQATLREAAPPPSLLERMRRQQGMRPAEKTDMAQFAAAEGQSRDRQPESPGAEVPHAEPLTREEARILDLRRGNEQEGREGLSTREIERRLGISRQTVLNIEKRALAKEGALESVAQHIKNEADRNFEAMMERATQRATTDALAGAAAGAERVPLTTAEELPAMFDRRGRPINPTRADIMEAALDQFAQSLPSDRPWTPVEVAIIRRFQQEASREIERDAELIPEIRNRLAKEPKAVRSAFEESVRGYQSSRAGDEASPTPQPPAAHPETGTPAAPRNQAGSDFLKPIAEPAPGLFHGIAPPKSEKVSLIDTGHADVRAARTRLEQAASPAEIRAARNALSAAKRKLTLRAQSEMDDGIRHDYAQEAALHAIDPESLHSTVQDIIALYESTAREHRRLIEDIHRQRPDLRTLRRNEGLRGALDYQTGRAGFDELATAAASEYPNLFAGHEGREVERLHELLIQGKPEKMPLEYAYRQALDGLIEYAREYGNEHIEEAGPDIARTIQAVDEASLRPPQQEPPATGSENIGDAHEQPPPGWLAPSGSGSNPDIGIPFRSQQPQPQPTPGVPGIPVSGRPGRIVRRGAIDLTAFRDAALNIADWWQNFVDFADKLGGAALPKTARLNTDAAAGMLIWGASDTYAKEAAPFWFRKVLGDEYTDTVNRAAAAVLYETRFRHAKKALIDASNRALAAGDKAAAAAYDQRAHAITTVFGMPGSVIKTEAQYQKILNSPVFGRIMSRYVEFGRLLDDLYVKANGKPPDSLTQLPGLPFNARALDPGDLTATQEVFRPKKGNLRNIKQKRDPFAQEAGLDAEAYDLTMTGLIQNSLARRVRLANHADANRALVSSGLGVWGTGQNAPVINDIHYREVPFVSPPKGTQSNLPQQRSLFLHPDVYKEYLQLLDIEDPGWVTSAASQYLSPILTKITLVSTTEFLTHAANNLSAMLQPRMRFRDLFTNWTKLASQDRDIQARIVDLARIGALKDKGFESGNLWGGSNAFGLLTKPIPEWSDPTYHMSRLLDTFTRSVRLSADDAYTRAVQVGAAPDTVIGRANFINKLTGNYNKLTQSKLIAFLRNYGINPFATAAANFNMRAADQAIGMRTALPATSLRWNIQNRASMLAKALGIAASAAALNLLISGRWDGDDVTPIGAIRIGVSADGETIYLDPFRLTGTRRAARATGLTGLVTGLRRHEPQGKIADRMADQIGHSLIHPAMGPIVSFGHTAATGNNAVGVHISQRAQPGESQHWQDLLAAMRTVNPVVSAFGGERPRQPVRSQDAFRLLGPFGPQFQKR